MNNIIKATLTTHRYYDGEYCEIDENIELYETEDGCKAINVDEGRLPWYEEMAWFDDEFQKKYEHDKNVLDMVVTRVQECETDYIFEVYYKRRDNDK